MHDAIRHTVRRTAALRVATLALAALLAVGTFLSAIALGKEVHHQCTGDDCPVCRLEIARITPLASVVLVASSPVSLGVRLDI